MLLGNEFMSAMVCSSGDRKKVCTERIERIEYLIRFQPMELDERRDLLRTLRIVVRDALLDRQQLEQSPSYESRHATSAPFHEGKTRAKERENAYHPPSARFETTLYNNMISSRSYTCIFSSPSWPVGRFCTMTSTEFCLREML